MHDVWRVHEAIALHEWKGKTARMSFQVNALRLPADMYVPF